MDWTDLKDRIATPQREAAAPAKPFLRRRVLDRPRSACQHLFPVVAAPEKGGSTSADNVAGRSPFLLSFRRLRAMPSTVLPNRKRSSGGSPTLGRSHVACSPLLGGRTSSRGSPP